MHSCACWNGRQCLLCIRTAAAAEPYTHTAACPGRPVKPPRQISQPACWQCLLIDITVWGWSFGSFKCSTSDNTLQFHVLSSDVLLSTPLLDHLSSINCSSSILHTHVDCLSQGTLVWSSQFRAYLLPTRLSESKLVVLDLSICLAS